jgi:biopolymer transport protein TolQ
METELIGLSNQENFSIGVLFFRASLVVKIVMIILVLASMWAWVIIIQKTLRFRFLRYQIKKFEKVFWSGKSLDEIYQLLGDKPKGPMSKVFFSGMEEWERSHQDDGIISSGFTFRIEKSMDLTIIKVQDELRQGLGFLATVASAAPFIGLFGTVWGIKNAFEEIGISQSTSLAIVAPGIAEALGATALGLLAAIPAVVFYNKLSSDLDGIVSKLEVFSDEFSSMFSRQLENQ